MSGLARTVTVGPLLVPLRRENASARGAGTAGGSGLAAQARSGREWSRQPLSLGGIALWARPGLTGPTDSSSELAAGLARTETVGCFGLCGARTPMRWRVDCGTGDNVGGIQRGGHDDARGLPTARSAHARRFRRRSIATTTRSRLGARSPSSSRLPRGAGAAMGQSSSGAERRWRRRNSAGRYDSRGFRRRDRRTHDEVGGARSQRRRARGSARARRRRVGS